MRPRRRCAPISRTSPRHSEDEPNDHITLRSRPRAAARRVRHPHPHRARRGRARSSTTSRWPGRFLELGMARLRAQVALRVDRRAGERRPRRGPRGAGARRDRAEPRGRRHQPARGRDRRARGCAHRLVADRRLASTSRTSARRRPGRKVPVWVKLQLELREQGIEIPPVPVVDDDGAPAARGTRAVLGDDRPAQDWCSPRAISAATRSSRSSTRPSTAGVEQIVITHPEFPSQDLSVEDQHALADRGALLERCFTTPHTGKIDLGELDREHPRDRTRALGPVDRSRPGVQPAGRGRDAP